MPFILLDLNVLHLFDNGGNLLTSKYVPENSVKVVFVALEKCPMHNEVKRKNYNNDKRDNQGLIVVNN